MLADLVGCAVPRAGQQRAEAQQAVHVAPADVLVVARGHKRLRTYCVGEHRNLTLNSSTARILDASVLHSRSKVLDYVELMKPELTFLSVLSTLCGFYLGFRGQFNVAGFVHTALGTTLLGGGVGALNQFMERDHE